MRSAYDKMDRFVGRTLGRLDDLLDGWMTASHDENDPIRGVDRECDLFHFQIHTPSAVQQNEMEARCNLHCLRDPSKIARRPRATELNGLRWLPVEITHFRRKRFVASVETTRQRPAEHAEIFLRRVNLHTRIDL